MADGGGIPSGEIYFVETEEGQRLAFRPTFATVADAVAAMAHAEKGRVLSAAFDRIHDARKSTLRFIPQLAIALLIIASLGLSACAALRDANHDTRDFFADKERRSY